MIGDRAAVFQNIPRNRPAGGDFAADQLAVIRSRGLLGRFSPEQADEVIRRARLVHFPSGRISFPDRDGTRLFVVVSGVLRYYLSTDEGRQLTVKYVGEGDGVGALMTIGPGLSTGIQAIEPSLLLELDMTHLMALADQQSGVSAALLAESVGALRAAYRALARSAFGSVRSRLAGDLVERARAAGQLEPGGQLRVTQQALADATGSVREVVARALRELRRAGVIETNHLRVRILDPDALIAESRRATRKTA